MINKIKKLADNIFDDIVEIRRHIHKNPELSFKEHETSNYIKSVLTNNQISLSIKNKELILGTWQGLYLFEHKLGSGKRIINHHCINVNINL